MMMIVIDDYDNRNDNNDYDDDSDEVIEMIELIIMKKYIIVQAPIQNNDEHHKHYIKYHQN